MQAIMKFIKDEDGVTAIEYAILAAAVAGGLAVLGSSTFATLGNKINNIINGVGTVSNS